MELTTFTHRIEQLREAKEWTQAELAEKAELAPSALSRILGGHRKPHMDHVIALARALATTVTELVADTDVADVLADWISRSEFQKLEASHAELQRQLGVAEAQLGARDAELLSVESTSNTRAQQVDALESEVAASRAKLAQAELDRAELLRLRRKVPGLSSALDASKGEVLVLQQQVESAQAAASMACSTRNRALHHIKQLTQDLAKARGDKVAVAAVSATLALIAKSVFAAEED